MELKNTTTTLVQRLSSTEARLIRVEVLVLFSTLAWVLLELFGSFRRRYSHGFFRLLVWTVYTLSTVLAPYTIGLLQAGPFRDQTFVLWGTILLLIQVNPVSLSVYSLLDATRKGQKSDKKIKLADTVIIHILSQFKKNNGKLENGQAALARNQLGSQFSWACNLPTHIHTILVWHIATTISRNELSLKGNDDLLVAVRLSDYCAYLVAFVPDMLPGHGYDTRRIFDAVVMEARQRLAGCETLSGRYEKLITGLHDDDGTILYKGAELGRQLRDNVPDQGQRWKVLADFWAEFILFLAPSDNADIHAEMLATGGELMTHLWALLTHAGILGRPSSSSGIDHLGGFNGTTAQESVV
ncbi:hypothetical protein VPH35_126507 [Triticum aestivum]